MKLRVSHKGMDAYQLDVVRRIRNNADARTWHHRALGEQCVTESPQARRGSWEVWHLKK